MSDTKISKTCVAVSAETRNDREIWIAAKGASVFQSKHMNMWLREQINCLINEGNNIKANIWDLQKAIKTIKAELRRIKPVEDRITFLETQIEAVKKNQEEERIAASLEEQYLEKLEKDKENLHLRIIMLSEKSSDLTASKKINQQSYLQLCCHVNKLQREVQECNLICAEEDEVFTKMKHQIRELEGYIKEYQVKVQVLQDREKALQDELSAAMKRNAGVKIAWVFIVLWHFAGILLVILLLVILAAFCILGIYLSNHTMTEAYQKPMWQFLDYYFQPYMQLYSNGILPK
ncbi:hypothetical protein JRQ81_018004 [Phrynocephalus forsythii]|uniref:Uncharacterized protein n=1 Tax=Phrynocephalus forsythii TaxID=171643 RepID=A0A9Q0XUQ5_9SAUR|nr:hypothetical protein JRQ81_018004 [Phrynocephalus forsythii]